MGAEQNNLSFSVFGIIENIPLLEQGIVLIQDKGKNPPFLWKLPGGKTEDNEFPEWALLREINEELGIVIKAPKEKDLIFEETASKNHVFRAYTVNYFSGNLNIGKKEIKIIGIFSREEVKGMILKKEIIFRHARGLKKFLNI